MTHSTGAKRAFSPSGGRAVVHCLAAAGIALSLAACGATQIDRHGHVFTETDLQQIQTGMSKDQVRLTLGTPDTTGTIGGDVFYYISSTRHTKPLRRPEVVDRKVLAVYFDKQDSVTQVSNYGLKDGIVFDFIKGETPTGGKQLTAIEQLLGNIANRRQIYKENQSDVPNRP